jgi:hypothetical protein
MNGLRRYLKAEAIGWPLFTTCAIAFVVVSLGCARENAPPTSGGQTSPDPTFIGLSGPLQTLATAPSLSVSKFLKAKDGGELDVQGVKVRFDKSSLPSDMTVTLTLLDSERLSFRVEPAGLVLAHAATIKTDKLNLTNGLTRDDVKLLQNTDGTWSQLDTHRDGSKIWADISVLGDYGMGFTTSDGQDVELISWLDGAGYRTRLVRADKGGVVKYGRFQVTFPAGALKEDTYITIRDPGLRYMMCDLEPEGIRFNQPVELEVDLKGTGITGDTWTIFWWNPATGLWEDQHGVFSGDRVNASLGHFSTYAPGKAGW